MDFSWDPGSGSCDPRALSKWCITPDSLVYTILQKKGNFENVAFLLRLSVCTRIHCTHFVFMTLSNVPLLQMWPEPDAVSRNYLVNCWTSTRNAKYCHLKQANTQKIWKSIYSALWQKMLNQGGEFMLMGLHWKVLVEWTRKYILVYFNFFCQSVLTCKVIDRLIITQLE